MGKFGGDWRWGGKKWRAGAQKRQYLWNTYRRGKSYHGGSIGTHQRSFERYHPRPPKASSFPILRVRNPIEKPQSLLSQERVKLHGLQIWPIHSYRVHPNQTHFGKSECGHIQGLSKVLKYTPYYLRNGYSYTNFKFCTHIHGEKTLKTYVFLSCLEQKQLAIKNLCHYLAKTRQHSYRKEDRAMRPIYGCTEKFWESSLRIRLLFQKFVMDFCSDRY